MQPKKLDDKAEKVVQTGFGMGPQDESFIGISKAPDSGIKVRRQYTPDFDKEEIKIETTVSIYSKEKERSVLTVPFKTDRCRIINNNWDSVEAYSESCFDANKFFIVVPYERRFRKMYRPPLRMSQIDFGEESETTASL